MDNDTPELFDSEPVAVKLTVADGRDGDISNDDIRDGDISNDDIREGGPPVNAEDGSNAIDDKSDGMIRRENVVEYRTDDDDDDDGIYDRSAEDTDRPAGRVVDGDSSKTTENVRHKGLPPGRVKLIMKMDPDVNIVAGEAVYLVTKATEHFVGLLTQHCRQVMIASNKKTLQKKHIDSVIEDNVPFEFLEGALDW